MLHVSVPRIRRSPVPMEGSLETGKVMELKNEADGGNPTTQFVSVGSLKSVSGVSADAREAARYFKFAANQNIAEAQVAFGRCLKEGSRVSKDIGDALTYFELAVAGGVSLAQTHVNRCRQLLRDSPAPSGPQLSTASGSQPE